MKPDQAVAWIAQAAELTDDEAALLRTAGCAGRDLLHLPVAYYESNGLRTIDGWRITGAVESWRATITMVGLFSFQQ